LLVEPNNNVHAYRIVRKEKVIWEEEELLQWEAGSGMTALRLEDVQVEGVRQRSAVTEIIEPQFFGLESPRQSISGRWATLEIRQLITGGGYGMVLWRGARESYHGERSAIIFNDFQNRFLHHLINLGHVRELERILIRPTDDLSRVFIERIGLYSFELSPLRKDPFGNG
jgi:hypothetical protein